MNHRLHALCPYFAMFPPGFVRQQLEKYTKPGDLTFDPFSGRGTALLEALLMGRQAAASDINPVAFCITGAKANIPPLRSVMQELDRFERQYEQSSRDPLRLEALELPSFFRRGFYHTTLRQILFLRRELRWRDSRVHRFIAALVLGSLHGEMDKSPSYFSNQMPRIISTKPRYSLKFWSRHNLWPRKRDVFQILKARAKLRLSCGIPQMRGRVALVDARQAASAFPALQGQVVLVITSPPYLNVTRYEEDQWLRLWFLGYDPRPTYGTISGDDRHSEAVRYWRFLSEAWKGVAPLLRKKARILCRIGAKDIQLDDLTERLKKSLREVLPHACLESPPRISSIRNRQTERFRPGSKGCLFEVDYVFAV